ncbi:sodium/hydrogen exchanger [Gloeomargarita lithophora Alchichica-D10]|uniref:Sodium/hydrogen exchanger n=1 Tax=Gloeomargarita lithophora Alchichica-D10 TaxID=1188229 RepID=A0A1J0A913_9CYAN|nr:cation:proton antiporter [Gloeomargarita lithophora]APB32413.1 sodium/hydrogen exchanger [Gloeomargarita lithophora Alchichica-D10]
MPTLATAVVSADATAVLITVLLSLTVIYLASRLGGEICARFDLPPVLGELLAGSVVGISILHLLVFPEGGATAEDSLIMQAVQPFLHLSPAVWEATFSAQGEVVSVLSELGVIILLFEIGLESNLQELLRVGAQAVVVAVIGVTVPFVAGTLGLIYLFHVPTIAAIFAGAALTATSIGITAKVLAELQQLNSSEGQVILGAAVLDDILGIIILAVVASLVKTGEVEISQVVYLIVGAAVFLVGSVLVGRLLSPWFVGLVSNMKTRGSLLIVSLLLMLVLSVIGAAIQLEAILGAFTAGLILSETNKQQELEEQVIPLADFFVPIFFVCVGAKTDFSVFNPAIPANREGLVLAGFLVVVAIVGKVASGLGVGWGTDKLNRLAVGVGMIPRGEVGLVFAAAGASSGALSEALDAGIVVMVILTTFLAPPMLRFVFPSRSATPVPAPEPNA